MIIELIGVTVERPGKIRALDAVSCIFDSEKTNATAVLGANGAGKSTLLEAVLGLVPLADGKILVDGIPAGPHTFRKIREKIGMVFQNADNQLFSQTVAEDVAFGPRNLHLPPEEIRRRVENAMEELGIASLSDRDLTRLSGGEKRRTALAGVLAMEPETVLLDEPTSMLDPRGIRELAAILKGMEAMKIIATHDLCFAEKLCSRAIVLENGRIRRDGPFREILSDKTMLEKCGLA